MASLSAVELFQKAGLLPNEPVSRGEAVPCRGDGVHVISIADPPNLPFDGRFARERRHWNPEQEIVYIGRSCGLRRRLRQFYKHAYGAPRPHRGGQAILLLECAKAVQWACVADHAGTERRLLELFKKKVGRTPFGNRVRSARMPINST